MKRTLFAVLLITFAICGASSMVVGQSRGCAPSGGLNFICGMQAPEDLVLIPNSRWLLASGMMPGSGLHLIDTQTKTANALAPAPRADKAKFANCPGPLD